MLPDDLGRIPDLFDVPEKSDVEGASTFGVEHTPATFGIDLILQMCKNVVDEAPPAAQSCIAKAPQLELLRFLNEIPSNCS